MRELAERVRTAVGSGSEIIFEPRPADDPERRCPDISLMTELLGWRPAVTLEEGLDRTVGWCRRHWLS